jgi:hypothetical protein
MALFEGKTPAERNKMIAGIVLPLIASLFVVRMLFFSSGPARPQTPTTNRNANSRSAAGPRAGAQEPPPTAADENLRLSTPVVYERASYSVPDAGRNIFAFYEPPPKPVKPPPTEAPPTPAPTPPLVLAGLSPSNVYARTAGFALQLSGDKFVPGVRIYVDGQEQPTQYRSTQQLTANVPAALIAAPGTRTVAVRTPDGKLYSNDLPLNVMQPPAPTYTYVGLLSRARFNTAVLKDQKGELYSVRAGDIVEGRFRVVEISDRGVEVVDKDLNIKHTMPFVESRTSGGVAGRVPGSIQPPPPPPPEEEKEGGEVEEEP